MRKKYDSIFVSSQDIVSLFWNAHTGVNAKKNRDSIFVSSQDIFGVFQK